MQGVVLCCVVLPCIFLLFWWAQHNTHDTVHTYFQAP